MRIKSAVLVLALIIPAKEYAQTQLNKTIPVKPGQKVNMHFDYPELVRVSTWNGNEILVQGTVSINNGENDEAFIFENNVSGNTISINAFIKDLKNLPQRVTVVRDGQKMMFRDKTELKKYQQQHGTNYERMSWGPDIEIELDIKVPQNMETHVKSVYGMVEIKDFRGPLVAESMYGGVDASIQEHATGEIIAETNFGEIFTNLDAKFGGNVSRGNDFHTYVSAKPGSGPRYSFESKFGNVYIRKAGN